MSKRLQPYRSHPPPWLEKFIHRLPQLYLVGVSGYTSFILADLNNHKYKITIGNELRCSCSPNLRDQCIHTLFVLRQIFWIEPNDPLCWQASYLNKELRFFMANRRIRLGKVGQFLKHVRPTYLRNTSVIMEESDEDDNDELCAICQQQIVRTDLITSCVRQCKNNFHLDCFRQWAQHESKTKEVISCPLCRDAQDNRNGQVLLDLRKQQTEQKHHLVTKKIGNTYNYYCDGCNLEEIIEGSDVYKCAVCQDNTLCTNCFNNNYHIRHSFILKKAGSKKWTFAEDRAQKRKLDQQQRLIRIKLTEPRFYNFLASTLPCFFSKNTRWNIIECKRLEIRVEDLQCIACDDKQKAFLRRLYCGHFIHHKCLKRRIEKGKLYCKLDGEKYLLGYGWLMKHQKLNRIMKKQKQEKVTKKQDAKDDIEEQTSIEDNKKQKTQKSSSLDDRDSSRKKTRNLSASNHKKMSSRDLLNRSFNPQ